MKYGHVYLTGFLSLEDAQERAKELNKEEKTTRYIAAETHGDFIIIKDDNEDLTTTN